MYKRTAPPASSSPCETSRRPLRDERQKPAPAGFFSPLILQKIIKMIEISLLINVFFTKNPFY
ncbi:hypothetical protein GJA_125 [Janthinobacterium agaricidamnosum NBRC 102515 = DSM 9628]|uniref:Uncharacterized protein n=1 Tax=Janthinobacterium agaricidamnosum NBRC 102515 = DSM 9628 TaxID=1349767 RepID=W0UYR8_9BURK|nr:hypothetical protein GJA_125 [Janthinobacterium agaricidamnosum NBRC 102515 = DSM 9628]